MATMAAFERTLERGIDSDRDVVVDLSDLTFIDAAGLRALARTADRVRRDGRRLHLARPDPNLRRLLRLAGLDEWLCE